MDTFVSTLMQRADDTLVQRGFIVGDWRPHGNTWLDANVTCGDPSLKELHLRCGKFQATQYIKRVNLGYFSPAVQSVIDATESFRLDLRVAQFTVEHGWFTNYLEIVLLDANGVTAMLSLKLEREHYDFAAINRLLTSLLEVQVHTLPHGYNRLDIREPVGRLMLQIVFKEHYQKDMRCLTMEVVSRPSETERTYYCKAGDVLATDPWQFNVTSFRDGRMVKQAVVFPAWTSAEHDDAITVQFLEREGQVYYYLMSKKDGSFTRQFAISLDD